MRPKVFEGGLAVGEKAGVVGEEGQGSAGMERDADELARSMASICWWAE